MTSGDNSSLTPRRAISCGRPACQSRGNQPTVVDAFVGKLVPMTVGAPHVAESTNIFGELSFPTAVSTNSSLSPQLWPTDQPLLPTRRRRRGKLLTPENMPAHFKNEAAETVCLQRPKHKISSSGTTRFPLMSVTMLGRWTRH